MADLCTSLATFLEMWNYLKRKKGNQIVTSQHPSPNQTKKTKYILRGHLDPQHCCREDFQEGSFNISYSHSVFLIHITEQFLLFKNFSYLKCSGGISLEHSQDQKSIGNFIALNIPSLDYF